MARSTRGITTNETNKVQPGASFSMFPSQNRTFPGSGAGVKTPQQTSNGGSVVDYLGSKGQASDFGSRTQLAGQYGISGYTGTAAQNIQLLKALQGQTTPGYNPSSVDIPIDSKISSDAFKNEVTTTGLQEKRKSDQANTLNTRFGKEEETLLKTIAEFQTGLAGLRSTQAREYSNLEDNPEGVFGPNALSSQLSRLSGDQALELSARTGQLNAYLDTLELYQGYRPQVIGSPQIDETTGNAFAYIQDPMTGEISTQDLGQMVTPQAARLDTQIVNANGRQLLIDTQTGQVVQDLGATASSMGGGGSGGGLSMGGDTGMFGLEKGVQFSFDKAIQAINFTDKALQEIDSAGAGWTGILKYAPGSKTKQFDQTLTTLKANIGFNELQRMRSASPTGGALGQVSNLENELLQSTLGSLNLFQSKSALKDNLQTIKRSSETVLAQIKIANGVPLTPSEMSSLQASFEKYGLSPEGMTTGNSLDNLLTF